MPSASMRAVSALTPSERRKASTVWWRARLSSATLRPGLGQEHPAVGLARDQPLGGEPRQHLGDRRLRHAEPGGDIDLPRLVAVLDQRGDQLDIILDQRAAARRARLPEALGMRLGIGQRFFPRRGATGSRQAFSLSGSAAAMARREAAIIAQAQLITPLLPRLGETAPAMQYSLLHNSHTGARLQATALLLVGTSPCPTAQVACAASRDRLPRPATRSRPACPRSTPRVAVPTGGVWFRRLFAFMGPGYMVSVGYMDPGNWATDLAGGARFGYTLLFVIMLSNLMAILLQALAARLGIATGRDLAQACRAYYPRPVNFLLWIACELAIIACDLAEVIGTAIALQLLFGIPLIGGALIAALDAFLVLYLMNRGFRCARGLHHRAADRHLRLLRDPDRRRVAAGRARC